ncbi:hypothetical protein ALC53_09588 [Atta colombica]|uniref:Uncharacterized protein n=1 Tax=Atta colombica TaxID=520822 RepID=A0A195B729_9HYME|nr:hypothetical protein ALC53_09588 [Atta colombica]
MVSREVAVSYSGHEWDSSSRYLGSACSVACVCIEDYSQTCCKRTTLPFIVFSHEKRLLLVKAFAYPHLARIELIVIVDKRRQRKRLNYNNCHGLSRHALAKLGAKIVIVCVKSSSNLNQFFNHTVLLRSRSAREGGCTAKPSKPNQNISPCIEDESYRDRLSSFPYYESSSSRTRSFSMLAAPSQKGKRKHERMERVPSIDIVNNRRQFLYDIRATYWDETLVDLFAFTSVVSRMHRTSYEREKKCLAMPLPPTKPIIYDAKKRDMSKLLEAYPEGADLFLVCEVHGESDSDSHQMYVVRTEKSHFVEESYSLARGQFHLESSTQRTRGKFCELVRQQKMGREAGKSGG